MTTTLAARRRELDTAAVAAGIDASRRIGWARFYQQVESNKKLLSHNATLIRRLARFACTVARSEAIQLFEPELADEAARILLALRLRARGRSIVDGMVDDAD